MAPDAKARAKTAAQKARRSTPMARRGVKVPMDQTGFKWGQRGAATVSDDKEDWGCRFCYAKFAEAGRTHHYRFIAGDKLLCRPEPQGCGGHKGSCFLGVASEAEDKYQARLEYLRSQDMAGDGGKAGKATARALGPKPRTALEKQLAARVRRLENSSGGGAPDGHDDDCGAVASGSSDPPRTYRP